mmetsp:Transcript_7114/g.23125  ORF Transcript_7114/g.23125 Transcript_7114/m.23125 type:complete len:321 (+) Transcript_7114:342-1304(+)
MVVAKKTRAALRAWWSSTNSKESSSLRASANCIDGSMRVLWNSASSTAREAWADSKAFTENSAASFLAARCTCSTFLKWTRNSRKRPARTAQGYKSQPKESNWICFTPKSENACTASSAAPKRCDASSLAKSTWACADRRGNAAVKSMAPVSKLYRAQSRIFHASASACWSVSLRRFVAVSWRSTSVATTSSARSSESGRSPRAAARRAYSISKRSLASNAPLSIGIARPTNRAHLKYVACAAMASSSAAAAAPSSARPFKASAAPPSAAPFSFAVSMASASVACIAASPASERRKGSTSSKQLSLDPNAETYSSTSFAS